MDDDDPFEEMNRRVYMARMAQPVASSTKPEHGRWTIDSAVSVVIEQGGVERFNLPIRLENAADLHAPTRQAKEQLRAIVAELQNLL